MKEVTVLLCVFSGIGLLRAQEQPASRDLTVGAGKSLVVDSAADIQRVAVADGEVLEAVAISPREVLVNGKRAGETSLILWQAGGVRLPFNVRVTRTDSLIETVRAQIARELPGQDVQVTFDSGAVFLRGTVRDMASAQRAVAIASALGKPVNLLRVNVPPGETQVLLKVKFASVDRSAGSELGANLFSLGATNTIGSTSTQQFSPPKITAQGENAQATFSDLLNIFLFRPDLNLGATIRALQTRQLVEILAEPNLLAINGKEASFLAGGEYPYPTVQSGANGLLSIAIQFKEFGVRLNFVPNVTPRGTIRLHVAPEVSALDFANGMVYQGFNIPALSTRRVDTEVELDSGQSFAIAGLLDNRVTETLEKVPGLGNIPVLGKFFQSRIQNKSNSELLIMVTPEIVRPIPAGQARPELEMPKEFLKGAPQVAPHTPGMETTGPVPVTPPQESVPVEQLMQKHTAPAAPVVQLVPAMLAPVSPVPAEPPSGPTSVPAHN
jgi:pilus assembly protein CpaC